MSSGSSEDPLLRKTGRSSESRRFGHVQPGLGQIQHREREVSGKGLLQLAVVVAKVVLQRWLLRRWCCSCGFCNGGVAAMDVVEGGSTNTRGKKELIED